MRLLRPAASFELGGKVALVTGAARGIGLEVSRRLHERGVSVALVDLDADATQRAAAHVGSRTLAIAADVTDGPAMQDAVERAIQAFGGLDIPVANAGVAPPTATMRAMDPEVFERVLDINLKGVWRTIRPALDEVAERKGHVVLIASASAWVNGAAMAPYAASKAAVEQLGRALSVELAPRGAGATVAFFGFVDTVMVRETFADPLADDFARLLPRFVTQRLTAAEAADAVVAGIERRAPRVIAPRWWYVFHALRGAMGPAHERMLRRHRRLRELFLRADAPGRSELRGTLDRTATVEDTYDPTTHQGDRM